MLRVLYFSRMREKKKTLVSLNRSMKLAVIVVDAVCCYAVSERCSIRNFGSIDCYKAVELPGINERTKFQTLSS